MIRRITVSYCTYLFCILPFLEMPRFGQVFVVNRAFLLWKMLSAVIVAGIISLNRIRINKLDISFIAYSIIVIFSTIINNGELVDAISDSLAILVPVFLIEIYYKRLSTKELLMPMIVVFTVYTVITAFQLCRIPFFVFRNHGMRDWYGYLYTNQLGVIFALGEPKRFVFIILPLIVYLLMLEENVFKNHTYMTSLKRIVNTVIISVAIFCLVYSWSVSAIFAIVALLATYIFYSANSLRRLSNMINAVKLFYGFIVMNIFLLMSSFRNLFVNILAFFGKSTNLSGRVEIWERAYTYIKNRPIIGYGINRKFTADNFWNLVHMHNYLINCAYVGGILLLICIIYILYITAKGLSKVIVKDNYWSALMAGYVGFLVIALTDTPDYNMLLMMFPLMYACCIRGIEQTEIK